MDPDSKLPVLYEVNDSWEAARSDGERWRWAMAQIARRAPDRADEMRLEYAKFLDAQFGVHTLIRHGWLRPGGAAGEPDEETSALSVETLNDSETIARLATGVRRFTLPEGHRHIEIFRRVGAWERLHDCYLDRNQRPKAAAALREAIEATELDDQRERLEAQLAQIVDPWLRFDSVSTQAAGEGARLRVTYRNAQELQFNARPVDVAKLLSDVRDVLTDPPDKFDRRSLEVERIGWRLLHTDASKYLGEATAEWTARVESLANHRDAQQAIATPLQTAGAYLVEATPRDADGDAGAAMSVVVWVTDTALVRKRTVNGTLYQVLDARDGRPVEGATIDLVGYAPERAIGALRVGAEARAAVAAGGVVSGKVSFLARAADPDTRTFRVEAVARNADELLRDGQTVEISIPLTAASAHFLPHSALTLDDRGRLGVRVVTRGDPGGAARAGFAPVEILKDDAEGVWLSGLGDAAEVILVGHDFVTDGAPITVTLKPLEQ